MDAGTGTERHTRINPQIPRTDNACVACPGDLYWLGRGVTDLINSKLPAMAQAKFDVSRTEIVLVSRAG